MVATVASMGILVTANVAGATKSMDQMNAKVKDVGATAQKEGAKTEGFMKRWAGSFAVIGAAAAGVMYAIVKASPLLSGAMQEAQDAMSLLFMTIGDAIEPIIRPFVDLLWGLTDVIIGMPSGLGTITSMMIVFGTAVGGAATALALLPAVLHSFGLAASMVVPHGLALAAAFSWIVVGAGLVAAALYYISGDPVVALVGALTTIGIAANVLFHQPLIFGITSIVSGFALLVNAADAMQVAAGAAFLAIGFAATSLMVHPMVAAITLAIGAAAALATASEEIQPAIIGVFTAIGLAATALLANPVILAITLIVDAIYALVKVWEWASGEMNVLWSQATEGLVSQGMTPAAAAQRTEDVKASVKLMAPGITGLFFGQYGGYVPTTGPAFLHAGEYVVPAGGRGGPEGVVNVDYHPTIEIAATLRDYMDVEKLKHSLDEIYKRDVGRMV